MRSGDCAFFNLQFFAADDVVCDAEDHFFQEQSQMAPGAIVCWGDVFDPVRQGAQLVAFAEAGAAGFIRIVNGDGVPTVAFHEGETGDIGGTISHIDHVFERDGPQFGVHVIIHIFMWLQHAFVDAEDVLSFGGVADDAFGKADASILILAKLTAEDALYVRGQGTSV